MKHGIAITTEGEHVTVNLDFVETIDRDADGRAVFRYPGGETLVADQAYEAIVSRLVFVGFVVVEFFIEHLL